jgi:colanic acid biosynthesis glycosyl transferase WcaI
VKILLYTQFCTPEPIFKSIPFATELQRRGHEVRVLTGFPNYPGGVVYPRYRMRWRQREELEGVSILRVPLFPSHGPSTLGRIANYLSFAATSAVPLLTDWKPDVVYVYNLPTLGALASLLQRVRHIPFVLDVQDLWPDSVLASGMGRPWMRVALEAICGRVYRAARRIVTLSPGMADQIERRGVPSARVQCIYNWCDETPIGSPKPESDLPAGMHGRFNIVYAGNLGTVQGLEAVVEAARIAAAEDHRVQFVFLGHGVKKTALKALAASVASSSTLFLDALPQAEAFALMSRADALLLHLAPGPLVDITIPSKTQSYLRLGRPILAAIGRDAARLVADAGAGIACPAGNPSAIAAAALRLVRLSREERDTMGGRGRDYYESHLSLRTAVDRWERVFYGAIAPAD